MELHPRFPIPLLSTNNSEKPSSPYTAHLYERWQFATGRGYSSSSDGRRAYCGVTVFIKPANDHEVTYMNSDDGMSVLSLPLIQPENYAAGLILNLSSFCIYSSHCRFQWHDCVVFCTGCLSSSVHEVDGALGMNCSWTLKGDVIWLAPVSVCRN